MRPADTQAQEDAAWATFLHDLADHLAGEWPAMRERLGARHAEFVQLAAQQAQQQLGWTQAAAVARWVQLAMVWGPSFHERPGFGWAQALLQPGAEAWRVSHRLVRQSLLQLQQLQAAGEARLDPAALDAADARLLQRFGQLGRRGALHPPEPAPLPRQACDLEALELRLLQAAVDAQYVLAQGQWQRQPLPLPAPLRVDATHPLPPRVCVLAHPPGQAPTARLQLRARAHATCSENDGSLHPRLDIAGTHGLWRWAGHETRATSWPVYSLAQPGPASGTGTAVAEETSPEIGTLALEVCGLRDEAEPLGTQRTQLWAWPATQWWAELKRQPPPPQPVLADKPPAQRGRTTCRVESDGTPQDAAGLRSAFEHGLDAATDTALQRLLRAAGGIPGLSESRLDGVLALLTGTASLAWGWALGSSGMAGPTLMRVQGALDLQACQAQLQLEGTLACAGGRARLVLRCDATALLQATVLHEQPEPPLLQTLQAARCRFTVPWTAELTPLATDTGTLLQAAGPCTGALSGEAGLRPRLSGGSGHGWYAQLRLDAATLPLRWLDPLLGEQQLLLPLWPAQQLLDWSLG